MKKLTNKIFWEKNKEKANTFYVNSPFYLVALNDQSQEFYKSGQYSKALEVYEEAQDLLDRLTEYIPSDEVIVMMDNMARFLLDNGNSMYAE